MPDTHHENAFFIGRVQGVGFRYSTLQVAREFEVTGYVSNLPDGRVQVEVEGTKAEVERFMAAVQEKMHGYIKSVERQSSRRFGRFTGFTIQ